MDCIFCKIINKEQPADIVYEDDEFVCFKDINPKARIHLLIVPRKHISSLKDVKPEHQSLLGGWFLVAKKIAKNQGMDGYRLLVNVGRGGGQIIDHLHLHLLSGDFKITHN